jgi:predicted ATP-binding protein involved in virulence
MGAVPGLVVITAPNGYGKSTILKLLNDVAHGDYAQVVRVAFSAVHLKTSDSRKLTIERLGGEATDADGDRLSTPYSLRFTLFDVGSGSILQGPWESELKLAMDQADEDELVPSRFLQGIEQEFPYLRRVGPVEWRDMRSGAILTRFEILRMREGRGRNGFGLRDSEPSWLTEHRTRLKILYISANRLRVDGESRSIRRNRSAEMVEVWAERIKEQIRDVIRRYAAEGRQLEQAFPRRIITAIRQRNQDELVTRDNVESLLEEVRKKEVRYQSLGLVGEGQTVEIDKSITDAATLTVLETYLEDIKSKFTALEDVAERLEIFLETLNSMLLFKSLRLSADAGFEILSEEGNPIPPSSLSSGEQHLLILLGELVFGSTGGALILLDEPEISFHPEWQERFPKVLTRIIEINRCGIVMTTHSPTLIQDNWEAVVELADQVRR